MPGVVLLHHILLRSYTTYRRSAAILERWVFEKALILLDYPEEAFHYITAVCTVDLEMPNSVAAERTVARLSMMYAARSQARSSIFVYKYTTPHTLVLNVYESMGSYMCRPAGERPPTLSPAGSCVSYYIPHRSARSFIIIRTCSAFSSGSLEISSISSIFFLGDFMAVSKKSLGSISRYSHI